MDLANKTYKNNKTGDVIKVIDTFENIAILENKQKIDTRTLLDPNQYTEQIDPGSFFNNQNAYNMLAEKIKNISTANMKDEAGSMPVVSTPTGDFSPTTNESAILVSSEDDERAELARKYGASIQSDDAVARQNQAFSKLLGENDDQIQQFQKVEINRDSLQQSTQRPVYNEPVQRVEVEDPIIKMFKGVKRNVDFNISIDINNKIPRLDFIEMMEDSYETSIIEFLSDEFTKEIINNPGKIKSMISEKIKSMLDSKSTNSQITDSVTQGISSNKIIQPLNSEKESVLLKDLPKKTTRKTKSKKESTEK